MSRAAALLATIATQELTPRPRLSVSEWADRYRRIAVGESKGPWRTEKTPYLRRVMDAFAHPRVRRISLMKGSQTGGTEAVLNMLFYAIDRAPGLTMVIYPDAGSGRDQKAERLDPTIEATPVIAGRLGAHRGDQMGHKVRFDSMSVLYRGTVREHQMESFPARYVLVDELDRCGRRTAHLAAQRVKTYSDGKLVLIGKPSIAGMGIDSEYAHSDQRVFMVPCPHCGVYHERTFSRVRWPGIKDGEESDDTRDLTGGEAAEARARSEAWLKCPRCDGRCGAEINHWQLGLGVWCPKGHTVGLLRRLGDRRQAIGDAKEDPTAQWDATPGELSPPDGGAEHEGYHIPEWISGLMANPYGEAAAGYIARRGEIDQDWVNDHAGKGFRLTGGAVEVRAIRKAIEADKSHGLAYSMGSVPPGVLVLIAAVDVQEAGCWVSVYGYGERGEHRYLVWRGYVPAPQASEGLSLAALDEILYKRKWPRHGAGQTETLSISARCIDTGDRTDEVYAYLGARPKVCGVRGVGVGGPRTQRMDQPFLWKRIDIGPDGKVLKGGRTVLRINSGYWKRAVMRRLGLAAGQDDESAAMGIEEASAKSPEETIQRQTWHLPGDVPTEHLEQLTAEHYVRRIVKGRVIEGWELREGRRDNHDFDAACYAEALAAALGIAKLTKAPAPQAEAKPTPTPTPPATQAVEEPRMNAERKRRGGETNMLAAARAARRRER